MAIEQIKLTRVSVNENNPRTISDDKFNKLVNSILSFPKMLKYRAIVTDDALTSLGGNMRFRALTEIASMTSGELRSRLDTIRDVQKLTNGEKETLAAYWEKWLKNPTAYVDKASDFTDEEARQFIVKDNIGYGDWDDQTLPNMYEAEELRDWGLDLPWLEASEGEAQGAGTGDAGPENGSLNDRFVVPPFSVLDTRKGYWQARKNLWKRLIGDNGESRNDTLLSSPEIKYKDLYLKTRKHREEIGLTFKEYIEKYVPAEELERAASKVTAAGASILDPVMSEIVVKWFTPEPAAGQKNKAFDCFAGDSVFGFVSSYLGCDFTGIELRPEQAQLNNDRVAGMSARYINDDGQNVAQYIVPESQDLLFSCPPYFDLEHYSDLENDASNQETYEDFIKILENAFTAAVRCLKPGRFAVIVVADVRDKKTGFYYDFCGDIKRIFKAAGMPLYNEAILVETGASAAMRAARYMESRKVAKMHQNILVFFKGDAKNIKKTFKKIEYTPEDEQAFDAESAAQAPAAGEGDNL